MFLIKLKIEAPYNPEIPILGVCPKVLNAEIQTDSCVPMFIVALQTIAKRWKLPKYPTQVNR